MRESNPKWKSYSTAKAEFMREAVNVYVANQKKEKWREVCWTALTTAPPTRAGVESEEE